VHDTQQDERFKLNLLATGQCAIKFYAAFPLVTDEDSALGILSLLGHEPGQLTEVQQETLQLLAGQAAALVTERRQKLELQSFEKLFNLSDDLICIAGTDGYFKRINPAFESAFGWDNEYILATPYLRPHSSGRY
jgi:GAF domain-containing protein